MYKVLITLLIFLFPAYVWACEVTPEEESFDAVVHKADVIFYGKPIIIGKRYPEELASKDLVEITGKFLNAPYEVQFEVLKVWKGEIARDFYLMDKDGECGHKLPEKLEQPMLVFAKFDKEGLKIMDIGSKEFNALSQAQRIGLLESPIWQMN